MLVVSFVFSRLYFLRLTSWIHVADNDTYVLIYYCKDGIKAFRA